jgi:hypothetical protein
MLMSMIQSWYPTGMMRPSDVGVEVAAPLAYRCMMILVIRHGRALYSPLSAADAQSGLAVLV